MVKASEPQVRSEILDLVEQLTDQLQAGNRSAIEEILRQHPEEASQLREILPSLEMLAELQQTACEETSSGAGYRAGYYAAEPVQGMLGDFRIIRQIGQGGMGVVYEAQQISIQRTVALKVLPLASLVDSRALQRFKNEVTAIATLEHPHIVSVYSVGEERGIHYFAMQLIRGQSLAAVIRELRARSEQEGSVTGASLNQVVSDLEDQKTGAGLVGTQLDETAAIETEARGRSTTDAAKITDQTYFRNVVRLTLQATDALQHAHDHGIVHRDVKPGNLLLDTHGSLFVTDFGLARIETGAGVTMTGDVLGTLRYMSPEQVLANRVVIDHRTDIYSLGATLYELLALRPMWTGSDKAELVRQISFDEPVEPRRLNPSIPADLNTIVLKATNKNPEGRYQDAQSLSDDLQRFLDHQPIVARRPTWVQKVAKWSYRHHRLLTTAFMVAVISLSAGLIATWQAYRSEAVQRNRAESNYQTALATLGEMVDNATRHERMIDIEGWRRQTLEKAIGYYSKFAEENAGEIDNFDAMLHVYDQIARAYLLLEDFENAQRAATAGLDLVNLWNESSAVGLDLAIVGTLWHRLAQAQLQLGHSDESARAWEQAYQSFQEKLSNEPDAAADQVELSVPRFLRSYAAWQFEFGDPNIAIQSLRRAADICSPIVKARPTDEIALRELIQTKIDIGHFYRSGGNWDEATDNFRESLEIARQLSDSRRHLDLRAQCLRSLGRQFLQNPQTTKNAEDLFRQAISTYQELIEDYPWDIYYYGDLAACQHNLALSLMGPGNREEAMALLRQAQSHQARTVRHKPRNIFYQLHFAKHQVMQAEIAQQLNQIKRAKTLFGDGIEYLQKLAGQWPDNRDIQTSLARAHLSFGSFLAAREPAAAKKETLAALSIFMKLKADFPEYNSATRNFPEFDFHTKNLFRAYRVLSRPCMGLKQFDEAEAALLKAKSYFDELPQPRSPKVRYELGATIFDLAVIIVGKDGDANRSVNLVHEGLTLMQDAYEEDPLVAASQSSYGHKIQFANVILGMAQYKLGNYVESKLAWERAVDWGKQVPNFPDLLSFYIGNLVNCPEPTFRDYERAIELGEQILTQMAPDTDYANGTRLYTGIAHYHLGDYRQAKSLLADIMQKKRYSPALGYYFALTLARIDPQQDDEGTYRKADAKMAFYLGEHLKNQKSVNSSEIDFLKLRQDVVNVLGIDQESDFQVKIDQAQAVQTVQMFRPAAEYWKEVVDEQGDYGPGWLAQGVCLLESKQYDRAINVLKHAAQFPDQTAMANWNLGKAYMIQGQTNPAFEALQTAIDLNVGTLEELKTIPQLKSLQDDERFKQLMQQFDERERRDHRK